ncbi:hypothetical protein CHS0354_035628 [Potamilus streckersoni]|uniref:Uncharacterized protein n=1 Tax=Potamilus streckersoni TaxID=2493646 RepID=A0AAE0RRV5_9BIVA|nr:hypothetical protein CHS0354_035628 [Potamilus streckersoni]
MLCLVSNYRVRKVFAERPNNLELFDYSKKELCQTYIPILYISTFQIRVVSDLYTNIISAHSKYELGQTYNPILYQHTPNTSCVSNLSTKRTAS